MLHVGRDMFLRNIGRHGFMFHLGRDMFLRNVGRHGFMFLFGREMFLRNVGRHGFMFQKTGLTINKAMRTSTPIYELHHTIQ
jgi:hypothetical protein